MDLARTDLCRVYVKGGIPSCASSTPDPTPDPTPTPEPEPDPDPPRAPTDYVIKSCWVQYTADSWDNVDASKAFTSIAASELLDKGPGNYWSVLQLTEGAPADIKGVTASLVSPTGFVSPGTPFDWSVDSELSGGALDWQLTGTGLWVFQNTLHPKPQQWTIRWRFPNGQGCDARLTVT